MRPAVLHGGATARRKKRAGSPWVGGAGPLSYPRYTKARSTIQKLSAATRAAAGMVMNQPG